LQEFEASGSSLINTMNPIYNRIIIACWCFFFLYWLMSALRTKPIAEMQSPSSALAHRLPVALGWWTLAVPGLGPLSRQILPHTSLLQIMGSVICVWGLVFTIWARRTLAGNWSNDVTFKRDHELIRTGPYRFVRHPIYTGLLVMAVGTALAVGQLRGPVSVLLFAIGFWIKLRQEERLLVRHFPDAYPAYQHEVKALVPFVI
jgi:protein-S-isoprenylcysteine O-methyltransferase Ste14